MASAAIQQVKNLLASHPQIPWQEKGNGIEVKPRDDTGFTVWFEEQEGGEFIVGYDRWHEHFDGLDEAMRCFVFGLSDGARLVVTERAGFRYKWLLQYQEAEQWVDDQTTGLFFFPFWRRKGVSFLQNRWIVRP